MKIGLISENLKVAWWKKPFCIILNIQKIFNFPAKNWEPGFGFWSCKEKTEILTTFKRNGNHKEGTQIFDLFFYYIDSFFRSLGKAHPHWLFTTTSYRVPCSICIWNMSSWKNDIPPPTHCQWNSASRSKKKKLGQPIWMQISVKPVVAS